jgi:DNA repair protein RadD
MGGSRLNLRKYQREAIDALYHWWREGNKGNALIVAPTGSGKSVIMAQLIREIVESFGARVLVLTHVKELIQQDFDELVGLWPEAPAGVYSASLKRRELHADILFAGIQSIEKHVHKLTPAPEIVIVDEAHMIPRTEGTRYVKALATLRLMYPNLRVVGLSATPYRLDSGWLHKGDGAFFDAIVYDIPVQGLIDDGYLSPITTKGGAVKIDTSAVGHMGKEFKAGELEAAAMAGDTTREAVREVVAKGQDRRKWLVFACGVDHAKQIEVEIQAHGIPCGVVLGDTANRGELIEKFRRREIRALVNVNVLTTGFNDPEIDLLVLLRPTESAGLFVQMIGRGTRKAAGKSDCLVLDYAGNAVRHGPIDAIAPDRKPSKGDGLAPAKECPQCMEIIHAALRHCPACGFEFPPPKPEVGHKASKAPLLKRQIEPEEMEVKEVMYFCHEKLGKQNSVRIEYRVGNLATVKEWIFPQADFDKLAWVYTNWCQKAGLEKIPATAEEFLIAWPQGPKRIWAMMDGNFWKITRREW